MRSDPFPYLSIFFFSAGFPLGTFASGAQTQTSASDLRGEGAAASSAPTAQHESTTGSAASSNNSSRTEVGPEQAGTGGSVSVGSTHMLAGGSQVSQQTVAPHSKKRRVSIQYASEEIAVAALNALSAGAAPNVGSVCVTERVSERTQDGGNWRLSLLTRFVSQASSQRTATRVRRQSCSLSSHSHIRRERRRRRNRGSTPLRPRWWAREAACKARGNPISRRSRKKNKGQQRSEMVCVTYLCASCLYQSCNYRGRDMPQHILHV